MIVSIPSKVQYAGNGVSTAMPFPYFFLLQTDLVVFITDTTANVDTLMVMGTDYTVTGQGLSGGGTVTLTVALPTGKNLTIKRVISPTQLIHYIPNDSFPATTHEQALDRLTLVCQTLFELVSRSVMFPDGEVMAGTSLASGTSTGNVIPNKTLRAGKVLSFDVNGVLQVQ